MVPEVSQIKLVKHPLSFPLSTLYFLSHYYQVFERHITRTYKNSIILDTLDPAIPLQGIYSKEWICTQGQLLDVCYDVVYDDGSLRTLIVPKQGNSKIKEI